MKCNRQKLEFNEKYTEIHHRHIVLTDITKAVYTSVRYKREYREIKYIKIEQTPANLNIFYARGIIFLKMKRYGIKWFLF